MSDKELRRITVMANSAANKRIKRAQTKGVTSGVLDNAAEYGKFSVKGKSTRAELENAFTRVRGFLSAETSTVRGIKKSKRKMFKNLAKIVNKELPKTERISLSGVGETELKDISGLIWQQIDKLSEDKSLGITRAERYRIAAHAYNVTTRDKRPIKTKQGLFRNLRKFYNDMYQSSLQDPGLNNMSSGEQNVAEIYKNIT